jgi:hypothetical protein
MDGRAWQSGSLWAHAGNLKHDPLMTATATAFTPDTFTRPTLAWRDFEKVISRIEEQHQTSGFLVAGSVVKAVIEPEFSFLRAQVLASLQTQPPVMWLTDLDLKGYRRVEPGWIADRIACVVMAVELMQMATRSTPMFLSARAILEKSDRARAWVSSALAASRPSFKHRAPKS